MIQRLARLLRRDRKPRADSWRVINDGIEYHAYPLDDPFGHEVGITLSPGCPCGPSTRLLQADGDQWLVTHMPLDKRAILNWTVEGSP